MTTSNTSHETARSSRVLLVEDDDEIRTALTQLFEEHGYHVTSVRDGTQFVAAVSSNLLFEEELEIPDLIVTDVRLPGFNGLGVVKGLRDAGWRIPVFVVSAWDDEAMRHRCSALGDTHFFSKPLDVDRLLRNMDRALARYLRHSGIDRLGPAQRARASG